MFSRWAVIGLLGLWTLSGCAYLPRPSQQSTFHNPFPQLSKVAVAPFFNHSLEPTVDGRQFAMAYFNELQNTPGFEVVAVPVVEHTMQAYGIRLTGPEEARRLAQLLDVDAVVIGAVTDFTPYYPPRCAMQIEWYAANPGFHPIPAGYGLPWGTADEERIPPSLVFEAQRTLAREQLKTQEPAYAELPHRPKPAMPENFELPAPETNASAARSGVQRATHETVVPGVRTPEDRATAGAGGADTATVMPATTELPELGLPPDWPDPRGFTPLPPLTRRPALDASIRPVLQHTRSFNGNDPNFTTALESYVYFRDDARFGGWQSYIQRSEDFIRFCCHMHIAEMLTARGGAGETRVVWRWPSGR